MSKRTGSSGPGSLASAALTATSTLVVTGFAAVVGVVIAREFGRTEETDGFFAAYGPGNNGDAPAQVHHRPSLESRPGQQ